MNDSQKHISNHTLQAYLDQELTAADQRDVKLHLETCKRCREEFQSLDSAVQRLAALPEIDLEIDLGTQVIAQLKTEEEIPRGITWTLILEAIGAGTVIGLLIPALRAAAASGHTK